MVSPPRNYMYFQEFILDCPQNERHLFFRSSIQLSLELFCESNSLQTNFVTGINSSAANERISYVLLPSVDATSRCIFVCLIVLMIQTSFLALPEDTRHTLVVDWCVICAVSYFKGNWTRVCLLSAPTWVNPILLRDIPGIHNFIHVSFPSHKQFYSILLLFNSNQLCWYRRPCRTPCGRHQLQHHPPQGSLRPP
jgi:hypothetical protein